MFRIFIPLAFLAACVQADPNAAFSTVRVYEMDAGHFMITCVDSPRYCAEQAPKACPRGFDVESNSTNPADHGRMTMIIRCRK